jgi:hypothetical protein
VEVTVPSGAVCFAARGGDGSTRNLFLYAYLFNTCILRPSNIQGLILSNNPIIEQNNGICGNSQCGSH